MPTSKLDRLNKLFEGEQRSSFAERDPSRPHISDLDLALKSSIETSTPSKDPTAGMVQPQQQPWKVPDVAQYPRQVAQPPPRNGRDIDQISSDEDDEYLRAFSSKPEPKPIAKRILRSTDDHLDESYRNSSTERVATDDCRIGPDGLPIQDGEGNNCTGHFCPLILVAKLPYKYMTDRSDRVSRQFFADNRFYKRIWDIYYICPPGSMLAKPILLLPLQQVQHLIDQINNVFGIEMECPPDPFTVSFFNDGTPQPKLLGTSRSRDNVSELEASVPPASDSYGDDLDKMQKVIIDEVSASGKIAKQPTDRSLEAWKAKVERIVAGTKKNKAAAKKKKDHERLLRQEDWAKSVKRAQRYLGLRPKVKAASVSQMASTTSWSDAQQLHQEYLKKSGAILDPINVNAVTPFPFDQEVIIISIDVEAYERDHRKVTEVGISTLDTVDLIDIPLGEGGQNWIDQIRSRHFRVRERSHLVNKDFCGGDGNAFVFGKSEWVSLNKDEAAQAIDNCFEYPFSAAFKQAPEVSANNENENPINGATINVEGVEIPGPNSNIVQDAANKKAVQHILETNPASPKGPQTRSVILIGHDLENDVRYLRDLGCSTFAASLGASSTYPIAAMGTSKRPTIHDFLDTALMYRVLVKETQNQSLARVMAALDRTAWHLHNAGNDARYTLEAFIGIAIKERKMSDEAQRKIIEGREQAETADKQWKDEVERRGNDKTAEAEAELRKECKGWEKVTTPPLLQETREVEQSLWSSKLAYKDPSATKGKYELIDGGEADPTAVQRVLEGKKMKEAPTVSREFEEGKEPLSEEWSTAEWQT